MAQMSCGKAKTYKLKYTGKNQISLHICQVWSVLTLLSAWRSFWSVATLYWSDCIYATGYIVFIFPFIHSYVRSFIISSYTWNCFKVYFKATQVEYISPESIYIWTIGTLEGRLSFHDSRPQSPCPGMGLEVKTRTLLKSVFLLFLLWQHFMQIVGRTWLILVTWTCGSWSEGQHDLYVTVQWFCLISWRLFDVCTSYFGSMNQYDPTFDLKINVGCRTYISWSSDFAYILKTIWCMNIIIWDYESVWHDVWPQN